MEISAFLKDVLHQLDERAGEAPRRSAWHADCSVNAFSSPSLPPPHLLCAPPGLEQAEQQAAWLWGVGKSHPPQMRVLPRRPIRVAAALGKGLTAKGSSSPSPASPSHARQNIGRLGSGKRAQFLSN